MLRQPPQKWVLQEFYRMPKRTRVKQKQPLRDWSFHLSALGLPPDHGKVPCFKRTKPCSWLSSQDFRLMGLAWWILLFLEELLIGPLALSKKIQGDLESELTHIWEPTRMISECFFWPDCQVAWHDTQLVQGHWNKAHEMEPYQTLDFVCRKNSGFKLLNWQFSIDSWYSLDDMH